MSEQTALIVGAGHGLSASLARKCHQRGMAVILAARDIRKLSGLSEGIGAKAHICDASDPKSVADLFSALDLDGMIPNLVLYNPSYRQRAPFIELDVEEVRKALMISCFGGFLIGLEAAKRMVKQGAGAIFFTGASASVKGYKESAPFAMGKFGLRGLAQSMARELAPKNIHVAHFVIDGGIHKKSDPRSELRYKEGLLDPDSIAESYLHVFDQKRNAWTWEMELRPWIENF